MDLGIGYSGGGYYAGVEEINGKIYVFPQNAQHILVIKDKKIKKIEFQEHLIRGTAFFSYWYDEKRYVYLFPDQYPLLIRFDTKTEEIGYIDGLRQFYMRRNAVGEWLVGGITLYENELIFASPEDDEFLFMDMDTLKVRTLSSNSNNRGTQGMGVDGDNLWLIPMKGMTIIRWNLKTGETREYGGVPEHFRVVKWPYEEESDEHPFGGIAFFKEDSEEYLNKENIIITPNWGNMYLSLDRETGEMKEWELPVGSEKRGKNGYYLTSGMGGFVITSSQKGKPDCRVWYAPERKLYDINIFTREYKEVEIVFDYDDLTAHEPGFMEDCEWMRYSLNENAFNSLKDFLDNNITGNPFDREKQIASFSEINANTDGICGQCVYDFIKARS